MTADPQAQRRRRTTVAVILLMLLTPIVLASGWYLRGFVFGFSIDPELLQGPIQVIPFANNNLKPEYEIASDSPEHARVVEWLRANRHGWVYDMKDYRPHTGLWTPKLRINLARDRVSVGYDKQPGPSYLTWVSKRIPDAEQPVIPPPAPRSAPR